MSADKETLEVYQARARDYANMVESDTPFPALDAFIAALPVGGYVLDLGCGPGRTAAKMIAAGLDVDAVDASPAMIEQAKDLYNVEARFSTFDEITGDGVYDGVWANFSLVHAPKSAFPRHLSAIHKALKTDGRFHIGLKTGEGEKRDSIGRFYAFYTEPELIELLTLAGFHVTHRYYGEDAGLSGETAPWIIVTAHA